MAVTMQPSVSSCVDAPTLYELQLRLCSLTSIEDRQKIVDAMLIHDEIEPLMNFALAVVLKDLADHAETFDDLWQETTLRLKNMLLNGEFAFKDKGAKSFKSWFSKVILSVARRGWRDIRPLWMKRCVLVSFGRLDVMAAAKPDVGDLEILLIAIDQMEDTDARPIIREWVLGKTYRELSKLHSISVSTVSDRWHRGVAELQKNWPGEWPSK